MTSFGVIIEKDDNGYYAHIPAVQGCYAQGDTYEEARGRLNEVFHLILEDDCIRSAEPIQDFTT
ncbi:hypothetical protein RJ53_00930 [Methanocalculus chunghsingensis]|uniref:HicB-like antitoxin of toxin-antitoxin system domain-containing protein n=1 Tax=Methanocalculus chunghsingensis TaxID=156457 RepID=A0A8J7W7N9_9EURY|nr:type II toxin-antitoxin system HicB family antitoxin [Methanocalculus chunghsingensis]MBR1368130.1 hypothetical protein [Methanocalculus chunghsingensis]